MKSGKILKELLSLSRAHLQAGLKEDWEIWEKIFQAKKRHYEALNTLEVGRVNPEEVQMISEIKALEQQMTSLLLEKREEARTETLHLKQVRKGVTGYQKGRSRQDRRHFNLKI